MQMSMSGPYSERADQMSAIAARDQRADGHFVYAVTTTGVYCRPSCPARRAKAENIVVFSNQQSARTAGYRGCRRCSPDQQSPSELQVETISKLCRSLESAEEWPLLSELAAGAGLSPAHFHRKFKAVTGLTPKQFMAGLRRKRLRAQLGTAPSITDAIYNAGFGSGSRFYERAATDLGMHARQFTRGGVGASIQYVVTECSLGLLLVAGTERGICSMTLGGNRETLIAELKNTFSQADFADGDESFGKWVRQAIALVEDPGFPRELPLDIKGTTFQERVWRILAGIPAGKTVTYSEVATQLGAPQSVRAVAQACAANPVAVAIPCHRVIRQDGSLAGYRWGIERKRTLLAREAESR